MPVTEITACMFAEAIKLARLENKAKADGRPEIAEMYLLVCVELVRIERRHFKYCAACQAAENTAVAA